MFVVCADCVHLSGARPFFHHTAAHKLAAGCFETLEIWRHSGDDWGGRELADEAEGVQE